MKIHRILQARRKELGMTQEQLARRSGVTRLTVLRLEKGNHNMTVDNLFKILRTLDTAFVLVGLK